MKKLLLLSFCLLGFVGLSYSQNIYYQQDFEGGVPAGWEATGEWTWGNNGTLTSAYFNYDGNETNFMAFNDDAQGSAHVGGGRVTSEMIDLTAVAGPIWLEINAYFRNLDYQGANERFWVSYSTDGGASWEQLVEYGGIIWSILPFDVSFLAGETVMLAFDYDDGAAWNYGCGFDDIVLADSPVNAVRRDYTLTVNGGSTFTQAIAGIEYPVEGVIINGGYEPINSFDITVGGQTYSFDGYDIPLFGAARYEVPTKHMIGETFEILQVSVSNVNGDMTADENVADNSANITFNPVANVNEYKAAVVEEATGSWCPWCTRGTIYLDEMSKRFGKNFVGVAVHNQDQMVLGDYDGAITSFPGFTGFPSVIFNRRIVLDPSEIVQPVVADIQSAPVAAITVGGEMDNGLLKSSIELNFMQDVVGANHRVAIILTEDDIRGDGSNAWLQANAYAGGGAGVMGGMELLGGAISPDLFPYDHVGRALIGNYQGVAGEVVGDYAIGDVESYIFPDFFMNPAWNTDNMHVVAVLMDAGGTIVNAVSTKFSDAIANGLSTSTEDIELSSLEVYPNPVQETANIVLGLETTKEVKVTLVNNLGQKVSSQYYGSLSGNQSLSYDFSEVNTGLYFLNIALDDQVITKRITKQ